MKKSPSINRVLEVFWIIVSVLTGIMAFYTLFVNGFHSAYVFFIMCVLSFLLFLARRALRRKNTEKNS